MSHRSEGLRAVAAIAAAALLSAPGLARAYCRATTCDDAGSACVPSESTDCGTPLRWKRTCVGFAVEASGSSQIGRRAARDVLRFAFDAWENAPCDGGFPNIHVEDLSYVECARVEYNDGAGNANVVVFRDDAWTHEDGPHNIALTTVTYDTNTGEIFDADIEVNTAGYTLTTTDPTGDYDLVAVLTHEAGHFLGLAHSADPDATMFAIYNQGSTTARTLEFDDMAAICDVYPAKQTTPACNPIPRHGFASECASEQTSGDCSVPSRPGAIRVRGRSTESPSSGAPAGGAALIGGLLALALRRRRLRRP